VTISKRGKNGYGVRVWDRHTKTMRWVGTYPTLAEARDAQARTSLKPRRHKPVTIAEWSAMWLSDYAREAAATRRTYTYATRQIVAAVGDQQLADIDRPSARKLATTWPRNTARVARTMFGDAMRDGLIDFNPFSELRLETSKGRKDIDALTEPQIHELATTAERVHGPDYGPEAAAIILTLGHVGLRPGELCSVRRADLRPADHELTIRYTTGADRQEKPPKNGKPRIIVVPDIVLDALDRLPVTVEPDGRLFYTYRRRTFNKSTLAYFWRPIGTAWTEAGHKPVTLYHLRHACATLLLARGLTPADVALQLGHQDGGRLVQTLYGHPDQALARDRIKLATARRLSQPVVASRRKTDAA
jgi:integrase